MNAEEPKSRRVLIEVELGDGTLSGELREESGRTRTFSSLLALFSALQECQHGPATGSDPTRQGGSK